MRATGIIAEYNPFHRGHAYQAAEARRLGNADAVIAVMSGHITQRGEMALFDKWHRAQAAVCAGVDLVLELPAVFAVRSAQYFAAGGVRLLAAIGIVDRLSFGAEDADIAALESAATGLENATVIAHLKENMTVGRSYASAMAHALVTGGHTTHEFIVSPNNILGVEYLRALKKYAPLISPLPVSRLGSGYHDSDIHGEFPSATAIRGELTTAGLTQAVLSAMPPDTAAIITALFASGWAPADKLRLDCALLAQIRLMTDAELLVVPELSEGLENRLRKFSNLAGSSAELIARIKSKRYPYSRLQRMLTHLLLGTTQMQLNDFDRSGPLYARVLALNKRGQTALRAMSRLSSIPIITKTTAHMNSRTYHSGSFTSLQAMLACDIAATDLFALCLPEPRNRLGGLDFCHSAVHVPTRS